MAEFNAYVDAEAFSIVLQSHIPIFLIGWDVSMGLLLPVYLQSAQQAGGDSHLATASGLIQMARNMGGAMGIPLLGIWLTIGKTDTPMFASIFTTLALIGLLGILLGFASPRQDQHVEQSLSIH